jgi:microcystin-dependent protein
MKKLMLVFAGLALLAAERPASAGTEPFLGEAMTAAFSFCPRGWAPMNGQLLPINQNQALFALLGTNYGGDGRTTFALPTAKPIVTATGAALTQCIALQGIFPPRD